MKNIRFFYLKFSFMIVKFSIFLNRRVFVMIRIGLKLKDELRSQGIYYKLGNTHHEIRIVEIRSFFFDKAGNNKKERIK